MYSSTAPPTTVLLDGVVKWLLLGGIVNRTYGVDKDLHVYHNYFYQQYLFGPTYYVWSPEICTLCKINTWVHWAEQVQLHIYLVVSQNVLCCIAAFSTGGRDLNKHSAGWGSERRHPNVYVLNFTQPTKSNNADRCISHRARYLRAFWPSGPSGVCPQSAPPTWSGG